MEGELKSLAMKKMRNTYKFAAEVLVLDAYVQGLKFKGAAPLKAFARVVNSSWMQRLWTLQEGQLAQRLYSQFADGPVELRRIFNSIPVRPFPARLDRVVNSEIVMSYRASRLHTYVEQKQTFDVLYEGVIATREAVEHRELSDDSDEALCLSTLMGLDLEQITYTPRGRRMEALWESIGRDRKVPLSLVVSKAPEKLCTPGFHWAPSSSRGIIPQGEHSWREHDWAGPDQLWDAEATITQLGLLAPLPGLFLQPTNVKVDGWSNAIDMSPKHVFQLPSGRWFGLCLGESWSQLTKDIHPE